MCLGGRKIYYLGRISTKNLNLTVFLFKVVGQAVSEVWRGGGGLEGAKSGGGVEIDPHQGDDCGLNPNLSAGAGLNLNQVAGVGVNPNHGEGVEEESKA